MKRILFVSKGLHAASTRYRATDFFPLLREAGWEPHHLPDRGSPVGRARLLREAARADVVVLVRRTYDPFFARLLRHAARKLVFTFDDAIFARSDGSPSPTRERRFAATLPYCDQVWAGNGYLAEAARRFNTQVIVVPTAVDARRYRLEMEKPGDHFDLVWIGSRATRKHLLAVLPALETAAYRLPDLRLKIVADFSVETGRLNVLPVQWSSQREVTELASAHVCIAPLPDNRFTRGKCGLKVLQYMAAGLPAVSSSTGANREIVEPGRTGLLADTEEEWVSALTELYYSSSLRRRLGEAGRTKCERMYDRELVFRQMMRLLGKEASASER